MKMIQKAEKECWYLLHLPSPVDEYLRQITKKSLNGFVLDNKYLEDLFQENNH